jgi:biofilm PGA synthesis protein PgaD
MKAEAIIIQRPERQNPSRRALFAMLTLGAWLVWAALWLPLITLLAWLLGARTAFIELVMREHGTGWADILVVLGIGTVCALIEILWSGYNYRRFGNRTRRQARPLVDPEAMARVLKIEPDSAVFMREAPRIVLQFAEDGTVRHLADA